MDINGETENIFTEDTDINIVKSWLAGSTNGATWSILDRFIPKIEFKDFAFDEIEEIVDGIIGPCLRLKVDDPRLGEEAKRIVDGLNAKIEEFNANPSRYFKNASCEKGNGKGTERMGDAERESIYRNLFAMDTIIHSVSDEELTEGWFADFVPDGCDSVEDIKDYYGSMDDDELREEYDRTATAFAKIVRFATDDGYAKWTCI